MPLEDQNLNVTVGYHVDPNKVEEVYAKYKTRANMASTKMDRKVYEKVKNVFGRYTSTSAIQEREKLNDDIQAAVVAAVEGDGLIIDSVQIENYDFSKAYDNTVEDNAKAAALVALSRSNLERVALDAQQAVKRAEADAAAQRMRADADAYTTKQVGQAQADAIRLKADALKGSEAIVTMTAAERWDGKLPETMIPGAVLPMIQGK